MGESHHWASACHCSLSAQADSALLDRSLLTLKLTKDVLSTRCSSFYDVPTKDMQHILALNVSESKQACWDCCQLWDELSDHKKLKDVN